MHVNAGPVLGSASACLASEPEKAGMAVQQLEHHSRTAAFRLLCRGFTCMEPGVQLQPAGEVDAVKLNRKSVAGLFVHSPLLVTQQPMLCNDVYYISKGSRLLTKSSSSWNIFSGNYCNC